MRRFSPALLAGVVFAVVAPAAPVPKGAGKGPVYYFPTTPGATWEYEDGSILVVSRVEDRKGTKVVTVERAVRGGRRVSFEVVEVSAAGVFRTETIGEKLATPYPLLKAPFRAGDSWKYEVIGTEKIGASKGTRTVAGVEEVKVPAGTFEAVRVDADYVFGNGPGAARKASAWYAPNVGLVKMTRDSEVLWLLKSFTPGKE
ncbi:MAG: hypothetical protein J0I06_11670 [Planctomycetes bacterium]|nr:hypothetical protein [Planctomycetota bacterium]